MNVLRKISEFTKQNSRSKKLNLVLICPECRRKYEKICIYKVPRNSYVLFYALFTQIDVLPLEKFLLKQFEDNEIIFLDWTPLYPPDIQEIVPINDEESEKEYEIIKEENDEEWDEDEEWEDDEEYDDEIRRVSGIGGAIDYQIDYLEHEAITFSPNYEKMASIAPDRDQREYRLFYTTIIEFKNTNELKKWLKQNLCHINKRIEANELKENNEEANGI
jgi:hypothetical protein